MCDESYLRTSGAARGTADRGESGFGRSSLPILGNVLLDPGADALRLAATDLELGIERLVPARVAEAGPITLPARTLSEIVGVLPEAEATVAADTEAVT